jgi:uncharacterized membrane protein
MNRWRAAALALAAVGLVDALYLSLESLSGGTPYCVAFSVINCGSVTGSIYNHVGPIPVSLLGLAWFAAAFLVLGLDNRSLNLLLIPLWAVGVAFAGYLIFVEAFLLHAVCPYCTVAHVVAIVLGLPFVKIALGDGE